VINDQIGKLGMNIGRTYMYTQAVSTKLWRRATISTKGNIKVLQGRDSNVVKTDRAEETTEETVKKLGIRGDIGHTKVGLTEGIKLQVTTSASKGGNKAVVGTKAGERRSQKGRHASVEKMKNPTPEKKPDDMNGESLGVGKEGPKIRKVSSEVGKEGAGVGEEDSRIGV
jgi:hypothetical protein